MKAPLPSDEAGLSKRKQADEKLWQSLNLLRAITEGTTDAIFAKDREGRYLMINTAGARFVGKTPEEMIGLDDTQCFSDETQARIIARDRAIMKTGETRTDEDISTTHAGISRTYLTTKGPLRDSEGAIIGLFGVARDITERKQAEKALATQVLRYKTLMETSMDSIYVLDEKGDLQEANAAFLRQRGYTAAEVNGLNVADWDARYTREQLQERLRTLAGSSAVFETQHRGKDGSLFDVEVCATSVRIGEKPLFFVVTRDITERKRVEQAQRESQSRYEALVQSIDGIVWEADPRTFMFTFVSKQAERILGYPLERWLESPSFWPDHMHPADRDWAVKFCVDATARGEDHQFEYRMIAADGREVWLNDIVTLHTAPGQSLILRGLMVDITERKQAEDRLRRSEEKFKTLFDLAPVGISVLDWQHNIVEVNPALERIVRLSKDELLRGFARRRTYLNADGTPKPPDELASRRAIRENRSIDDLETGIVRENGEIIWTQVSAASLTLPEASAVVITQDITQRKQADQALRESETRFRQLAENISQVFWLSNAEGTVIHYVSPAYEKIWNRSRESLYANPVSWMEAIHSEDREHIAQTDWTQLGTGAHDRTYRIVRPDGLLRWIHDRAFPVRDESDKVIRIAGIAEDITDRKLAEERLRGYEKVVEGLDEMIVVVDRNYRYLLANQAYLKSRGLEREQLVGRLAAEVVNEEVFENVIRKKLDECFEGKLVQYEMTYCYPDRGERDLLVSYFPIEGRAGVDRCACVLQDITERKIAEAALRDSEERFRQIAENITEVFWVWTATPGNARCLYVSPAYATIWGRSCESLYASPRSWMDAVHPQDERRVREEGARMDFETVSDWTYRIVRPDQSIRWIRDRIFPVRDADGAVVRLAGFAQDITESKEAEEAVRKANRQLRTLSRRRIQEQEDERRRLSRELHDQIGQSLTAAKINVEALRATENPALIGRIDETTAILDQLLGQVRQISLDLRPPMLDDLGLVPALRSFVDEQGRRASVAVRFSAEHVPEKLDPEIQITCFRIAQEAITNAVRHAKATRLDIALRCTRGKELRLLARDDGIGFDARARQARAADLGLIGIKERAALVGGRAKIISSPRKGTTVDVSLPLKFRGERQVRQM